MVLINKAINEVTVKLVYYGPGLCGKTTNLEKIYANPKLDNKGKMISMSTETDRTLFFDFMPMELGTIAGQKVRVQLYTVPGQVFYDATRKLVLRGADGVVFVADSQPSMRASNIDSLENLRANLRLNRIDPDKVALVFQFNKRDLPNPSSIEEMSEYMKTGNAPVVEAAAINGAGVTATLRAAVARILDNLKNNVDTTIHEGAPLTRPDMTARGGMTPGSAGTPKLSMRDNAPVATPPPAPLTSQAPFLAASAPEPVADPFDAGARPAVSEPPVSPFHSPFEPSEPSAGFDAADLAIGVDEDPFDSFIDPLAKSTQVEPLSDPFAEPAATAEPEVEGETVDLFVTPATASSPDLTTLLATSRELVTSLEAALERAKEHVRAIEEMAGQG